jgi:hypothetical protein
MGCHKGPLLLSPGVAYSLKRIDSEYLNNPKVSAALSAWLLDDPD